MDDLLRLDLHDILDVMADPGLVLQKLAKWLDSDEAKGTAEQIVAAFTKHLAEILVEKLNLSRPLAVSSRHATPVPIRCTDQTKPRLPADRTGSGRASGG